ncbi:hypothetical protein SCG7109_AE_00460 [Chlamydiales bacterium SCGC AG-110-M15]|nr:hypothetical protein SCG7109_AE_00460 [Chlamydiales bacterium SCGC AG-110-M15]
MNDYYAELRKDEEAWKEELKDREKLANTLKDGLDD